MKYLLVALVVGIGLFLLLGRGRSRVERDARPPAPPPSPADPVPTVACARCGMHLPRSDALLDGAGRPYCGEEHRAAGPR